MLPGWEHEDTGKIVVIPRHLLLAEEADDLFFACHRVRVDEEQVYETGDVEEDGLVVEE